MLWFCGGCVRFWVVDCGVMVGVLSERERGVGFGVEVCGMYWFGVCVEEE